MTTAYIMISELKIFDKKIFNEINKLIDFETNDPFLIHYQINVNNFYTFNEEIVFKIFIVLKNNKLFLQKKEQKIFKKLSEKFEFLAVKNHNFEFIKNNDDYLFAIISVFILKAFLQKTRKFDEDDDFLFKQTQIYKKIKKYHSYSILNYVITNFTLFIRWVDFAFQIKQIDDDYRNLLFNMFIILENKEMIKKTNISVNSERTESF